MKEVIVVEGRDDTRRLREVLGADIATIETNGSAIDDVTLELIAKAHVTRGVIVFTDPDFAGQKIRNRIQQTIPTVQHAFLERTEAQSSRKGESLGVEHASDEAIKRALEQVHTIQSESLKSDITQKTLLTLGLIGTNQSAYLRERVTSLLKIGHTNGKQLLKRLHLFAITEHELKEAVSSVLYDKKEKEE